MLKAWGQFHNALAYYLLGQQ